MQGKSRVYDPSAFPWELTKAYYSDKLPLGFAEQMEKAPTLATHKARREDPRLLTMNLSQALAWLQEEDRADMLERKPCPIPLLLHSEAFSTKKLLIHYEGSRESARAVSKFARLFEENIRHSEAIIISPSFIPKSKMKEEEELIQLIRDATAETSFIKFNFSRIGDFWSYAIKTQCTLLVTTKNHQAALAKILTHFYRKKTGEYDPLSFYLST